MLNRNGKSGHPCLIPDFKGKAFSFSPQSMMWAVGLSQWPLLCWNMFPLYQLCREGNGTPLQYSCLENPMDGGAWKAAVHGVAKSQTWLSNFTFTFHFHALEKEMGTHSSVLAWRIPGTGEPGGLLSMGVTQSRTQLKWLSSNVFLLGFILYGILCASWTWVAISFPMLGKFLTIIPLDIFLVPFFFSSSYRTLMTQTVVHLALS